MTLVSVCVHFLKLLDTQTQKWTQSLINSQIPTKKKVFENHYKDQFGCYTFSASLFDSCRTNPEETVADSEAKKAALQYAADNVAILKIFIK